MVCVLAGFQQYGASLSYSTRANSIELYSYVKVRATNKKLVFGINEALTPIVTTS